MIVRRSQLINLMRSPNWRMLISQRKLWPRPKRWRRNRKPRKLKKRRVKKLLRRKLKKTPKTLKRRPNLTLNHHQRIQSPTLKKLTPNLNPKMLNKPPNKPVRFLLLMPNQMPTKPAISRKREIELTMSWPRKRLLQSQKLQLKKR